MGNWKTHYMRLEAKRFISGQGSFDEIFLDLWSLSPNFVWQTNTGTPCILDYDPASIHRCYCYSWTELLDCISRLDWKRERGLSPAAFTLTLPWRWRAQRGAPAACRRRRRRRRRRDRRREGKRNSCMHSSSILRSWVRLFGVAFASKIDKSEIHG